MKKSIIITIEDETMTDGPAIISYTIVTQHQDGNGTYTNIFTGNKQVSGQDETKVVLRGTGTGSRGLTEVIE